MFEDEYQLEFFKEKGYVRKVCTGCGAGFWTLEEETKVCGDTPCVEYSFIGASPMNREYTIDEVRDLYIKFFEERGR
jgi:alanyl-tRNA synthetase